MFLRVITLLIIYLGIFILGFICSLVMTMKRYYGGKIELNNTNPETEFIALKLEGNVDRILFKEDYALFKIDRSGYKEPPSQEIQGS